jgi:hypothetical protein
MPQRVPDQHRLRIGQLKQARDGLPRAAQRRPRRDRRGDALPRDARDGRAPLRHGRGGLDERVQQRLAREKVDGRERDDLVGEAGAADHLAVEDEGDAPWAVRGGLRGRGHGGGGEEGDAGVVLEGEPGEGVAVPEEDGVKTGLCGGVEEGVDVAAVDDGCGGGRGCLGQCLGGQGEWGGMLGWGAHGAGRLDRGVSVGWGIPFVLQ